MGYDGLSSGCLVLAALLCTMLTTSESDSMQLLSPVNTFPYRPVAKVCCHQQFCLSPISSKQARIDSPLMLSYRNYSQLHEHTTPASDLSSAQPEVLGLLSEPHQSNLWWASSHLYQIRVLAVFTTIVEHFEAITIGDHSRWNRQVVLRLSDQTRQWQWLGTLIGPALDLDPLVLES